MLKHRSGVENKAADALSRRVLLLSMMKVQITGFERLKEGYGSCPNFGDIYQVLQDGQTLEVDGFIL